MGYRKAEELLDVKKKIREKQAELETFFAQGETKKARKVGKEIDKLSARKIKLEKELNG